MSMLIPIRDVNPTHRTPVVTIALLIANVVAYLATSDLIGGVGDVEAFTYGAVPCDVVGDTCNYPHPAIGPIVESRSSLMTLFTSMFMHGDILHLGFNMLYLWVFGNNVEDRLGHVRFSVFYIVTGLLAAGAHIASNTASPIPIIGASGAISGILGAYVLLWPHARIVSILPLGFFFFTVRPPAWVALGLWFVVQVFSLAGSGIEEGGGGVAFWAHIGGFIAGLVLIIPFGGRRHGPRLVHRDDD